MISDIFIDTNVLAYAAIPGSQFCALANQRLFDLAQGGAKLWVNRQVLGELYRSLLRYIPASNTTTQAIVLAEVRRIAREFDVLDDNEAVTNQLFQLLGDHLVSGRLVHDTNIVAAMLVNGIDTILTNDPATSLHSRASSKSFRWSSSAPGPDRGRYRAA